MTTIRTLTATLLAALVVSASPVQASERAGSSDIPGKLQFDVSTTQAAAEPPSAPQPPKAPEPASIALALVVVALLLTLRRRSQISESDGI